MSMTEDYPGYPVRDAARLLGISVKAVRERLKRGTLSGRRVSTPQGVRWEVYLPEATRPDLEGLPAGLPTEDYPGRPVRRSELSRLLAEVDWLRSQVERVQDDARAAEERHAQAESELRQLLEREQHNRLALEAKLVRALPAPVLEEETAVEPEPVEVLQAEEAQTEPETAEPSGELEPEPETSTPSRPWWRFWSL